jgi:anion-transporting  ArsA/GET3 family ATPase
VDLARFCASSRVLIVAGKGGVGKTTVTATLATAAARTGMSVLIVEVEGKSGLAACFDRAPLEYAEAGMRAGVRARTLTPDRALVEYLEDRGLQRISRRLVRAGGAEIIATAVPGMKDILVLGKVKQLEQARAADLIVVDAPAAGHAIRFLLSPRGLLDAVRVGPIRKQAEDVIGMLSDPARCQVVLVALPEEMPVNELVDTAFALEDRVGVALAPVVINGCYERLRLPSGPAAVRIAAHVAGISIPDDEADALAAAARLHGALAERQDEQAARLAARLPLPQLRLPFLFSGDLGPAEIEVLANALTTSVAALPTVAT